MAPSETEQFLAPQPIEDLYGIRRAQAVELRRLGVESIGQLALVPPATALRILGRPARLLQERARGIDRRTILPGRAPESVRVRADFSRDVLDGPQARAIALQLVTDLAARLRTRSQAARTVTVTVRMADQKELSKCRRLPAASAHTDDLLRTVRSILDFFGLQRARMRRITIVAEDVVDAGQAPTQLTLDRGREARLRAEPVVDELNARYGPDTVGPAAALVTRSSREVSFGRGLGS